MSKESKQFLENLLLTSGPSGFEEEAQNVWRDRTVEFADYHYRDVMGNTVAILNPEARFRIMLAGHCDEIGMIVSNISEDGYVYFNTIGGVDCSVLAGSSVNILNDRRKVTGIIGKKAIHLEDGDERGKALKIESAFIDIGATSRKDAEKLVSIGDPVSFTTNYTKLNNGIFFSKGCDDKVGAFVVSEAFKILSGKSYKLNPDIGIYSTATTQEEVGLRGATTGAYGINPDVAFAVDVSWASDTPYTNKNEIGDVCLGKGAVLHPGPANNRALLRLLKEVAKKKKIPYQIQSSGSPWGTDTSAIQLSRDGTATALISIPLRYMHTQVETCSFKDLESTAKLIAETILKIKPDMAEFIPK